jgi:lipid II:glycine glycyltransferase (peptidoglycan interpeptide bridge formation enzyme)
LLCGYEKYIRLEPWLTTQQAWNWEKHGGPMKKNENKIFEQKCFIRAEILT